MNEPTKEAATEARLKVSRRSLLAAAPATVLALGAGPLARGEQSAEGSKRRLKIAALGTEFGRNAHVEGIVDRFLEGYGWEGAHYRPQVDLVSIYMDQFPDGDVTHERAARFDSLTLYPSIREALCQGGDTLAVDGVVI